MGGDISDSAKIGVGVLILCFLIGIVFNLFSITRSVTRDSINQLQGSFNAIADAAFEDYNNTTVFGTEVINVIDMYQADKMSIVVVNQQGSNEPVTSRSPRPDGTGFDTVIISNGTLTKPVIPQESNKAVKPYYYGYPLSTSITKTDKGYYTSALDMSGTKNNSNAGTKWDGNGGTFVNKRRKYDAHLIKDDTETVIGICFELH